jgi:hypothetical protein
MNRTHTMRPVQRPMLVWRLTSGLWRRSKASCNRWTNAVERITPVDRMDNVGGIDIV